MILVLVHLAYLSYLSSENLKILANIKFSENKNVNNRCHAIEWMI